MLWGASRLPQSKGRLKVLKTVIITALGVGGATVAGAALGFIFGRISKKVAGAVLGFAAGVMLAATFLGLLIPSLEYGGKWRIAVLSIGVFLGAACIDWLDRLTLRLGKSGGALTAFMGDNERLRKVMLFVLAIAIHNIPEGLAAGVGFGTGEPGSAFLIAGAIALQNIPEGMVIISPMLSAGISRTRAFLYAALTGLVEVIGTLVGYYAVSIAERLLPLALAFAGGTMLYVVTDEMIPEAREGGNERIAVYFILLGVLLMLALGELLG